MKESAISIQEVEKSFSIPHERHDSIKSGILNFGRKKSKNSIYQALNGVSFEIKKGEFFGIVGRNGSGKSTLLKMIAGIYKPNSGKIETKGRIVPFIELGVGFNPKLTGRENVFLNGAMLGMKRSYIEKNYKKIVEFAELENFMDQQLKNYSSGMQVRLAFACATFARAEILLVDEVLAVGDAAFQRKCFDHFRKLKSEGQTVVFVSHNMESVREFCDRAVLIEKGEVTKIGSADEVAESYAKLFQNKKDNKHESIGSQSVQITEISILKHKISEKDETIEATVTLKSNEDIDSLRTGYSIANTDSVDTLTGTNNSLLGVKVPLLKKGEHKTIVWKIDNIFKSGTYSFIATVEASDKELFDRRVLNEAFIVEASPRTPYLVRPKTVLEIEEPLYE